MRADDLRPWPRTLVFLVAIMEIGAIPGCGPAAPTKVLPTARVERGPVEVVVTAAGPVQPARAVEVKSRASGQILGIPFEAGAAVTTGTTLALIDPREELQAVRLAEADVMTAGARLVQATTRLGLEKDRVAIERDRVRANLERTLAERERARHEFERQRDLLQRGLASRQTYEAASTTRDGAEASVAALEAEVRLVETQERQVELMAQEVVLAEAGRIQAQVALDRAKERLADTTIRASIDGIVLERKVEVGQIIASGISNVGGGTPLLILADVSRLSVKAMVDEADAGRLGEGFPAEVVCDAFPEEAFEGRVKWVSPMGRTESDVTSFEVQVEVVGRGVTLLKPGMSATVRFVTDRRAEALWVPPAALRTGRSGTWVNLVRDPARPEAIDRLPVETGLRNQAQVEITGTGLAEGLSVVLGRLDTETPGGERGEDPIWFLKRKRNTGQAKKPDEGKTGDG